MIFMFWICKKEIYNTKGPKSDNQRPLYLWHCHLSHINRHAYLGKSCLGSFDLESYETCESCLSGKMTKSPFTGKGERAHELLELIHSDVCSPMNTYARAGFSYFITFIDSRYRYMYSMKYKSEAFEKFKEFRQEVEKQLGKSIKVL